MNVLHTSLEGRFKLSVLRPDGTTRLETRWFSNLILNQGLERWATDPIATYAKVGTSNTSPNFSQTAMLGFVASSNTVETTEAGAQATAPYYGFSRRTFRFNAGVAAGTLAEVGVGWADTNDPNTLWCRALILDANDDPTTITVLADEVLDVTYELRLYPDLVDNVFETEISGITYDCIIRASSVTSTSEWSDVFSGFGAIVSAIPVYNGTLGPITTAPNGVSDNSTSFTVEPYTPGTLYNDTTAVYGLNDGNLEGGITAINVPTRIGTYKMSFSPAVAKDNTNTLTVKFRHAWGRYTP